MQVEALEIPDVKILAPRKFGDDRGFFSETYNKAAFLAAGKYPHRLLHLIAGEQQAAQGFLQPADLHRHRRRRAVHRLCRPAEAEGVDGSHEGAQQVEVEA